jgi:hypothetical protein
MTYRRYSRTTYSSKDQSGIVSTIVSPVKQNPIALAAYVITVLKFFPRKFPSVERTDGIFNVFVDTGKLTHRPSVYEIFNFYPEFMSSIPLAILQIKP